ncbi:MAG: protein kinase [Deltaproteobacteria bacterium]|nr:protein kinase [Deltaproteobacteria bacterium]
MEVLIVFGMPVAIVGLIKYFRFRTRKLELEHSGSSVEDHKRIAELEGERAQLEGRVQNLETIVTSVDVELNGRLNRLAAQQSQLLLPENAPRALPAPAPSPGGVGAMAPSPAIAPAPEAGPVSTANVAQVAGSRDDASSSLDNAATLAVQAPMGGLTPGSVLMGRFEVRTLIGSGGMGAVYLAQDRTLGEEVALKTIGANISEDPEAISRFRREVGAARKISHKNVIRIHDLGEDRGLLFLSMEYFPGTTLGRRVVQRGRLPLPEALALLDPVFDAIAAAHEAGVVHRDIKPLNVIVNENDEVRVIDFGLAKASYMRTMTATGMIMGTPEYMAPEQVRGEPTDQRTDIYALAAMTFFVLCGHAPFSGDNPISVGFQQCNSAPPSPRTIVADLPEYVETAILRGLEKEPAKRFASAGAFKLALHGRSAPRQGPFAE